MKVRLLATAASAGILVAAGCHRPTAPPLATVEVPGGPFWMGSSLDERGAALETAQRARGALLPEAVDWVRAELPHRKMQVEGFAIMTHPVTQAEYFAFVMETDAPEPWIDPQSWGRMGTGYDHGVVQRFAWKRGRPQPERAEHPVVMVNQTEATAYCRWWGELHGGHGTLPTELQWEKAARGEDGRRYPWGNAFVASWVNTQEARLEDTMPVGAYPETASPYGVQDMAGNVFEWTRTPGGPNAVVVKGGSWNSDGGMARAAARHDRDPDDRHVAIGFRCVFDPDG